MRAIEIQNQDDGAAFGQKRKFAGARGVRRIVLLALGLLAAPVSGPACGPYFPNMLLGGGDGPLLVAPLADFLAELKRLNTGAILFHARLPTNSHRQQTTDADLADLRVALERSGIPLERREEILTRYQSARDVLARHAEAIESWQQAIRTGVTNPPPRLAPPRLPDGLPSEFADYLRGAIAWHEGRTNDARVTWQTLSKRPAVQRPFKSIWAAFMLAKSWEDYDADRAIRAFREVRTLARSGFADSLGLAASSLGWEARLEFRRKRYEQAIELYLEQLAAGDDSAVISLRWVASAAVTDPDAPLRRLAANPRCRRVITAWLLSGGNRIGYIDMDGATKEAMLRLLARVPKVGAQSARMHSMEHPGLLWLEAVEAAGIRDAEAAERFALAAYQCGDMGVARRWADRAPDSPLAQWVRAKLLLREGKLDAAAALLARMSRTFPVTTNDHRPPRATLADNLRIEGSMGDIPASRQVLGELGALRLARREFVEALDCLLRADFWIDAAYVAERVLTLEELKTYVDRRWPDNAAAPLSDARSGLPAEWHPSAPVYLEALSPAGQLRHLLARRLVRAHLGEEARAYFPAGLRPAFDSYLAGLVSGTNMARSAPQRAASLWTAALLARRLGLELMGTEVDPDWAVHAGGYTIGPGIVTRNWTGSVIRASSEELGRARLHGAEPEERFHYRYTAAALGWQAAQLMPDNSDETALVLCRTGSWLKYLDPPAADVFYKALVRRCRRTALGAEADRKRWFPVLDKDGRFIPPELPPN